VEKRFWTSKVFRAAAEDYGTLYLLVRLVAE
jgi:hypothetical protein